MRFPEFLSRRGPFRSKEMAPSQQAEEIEMTTPVVEEVVDQVAHEFLMNKGPLATSDVVLGMSHDDIPAVNIDNPAPVGGVIFNPDQQNILTIFYKEQD